MAPLFSRPVIRRTRSGVVVDLPEEERQVLRSLANDVASLLVTAESDDPDPSLTRLFPTAYVNRPDLDDEYRRLMLTDLSERHRWALETLVESSEATELTDEQADAWMSAINQVRLVLGTRLGIDEDMSDLPPTHPDAPAHAAYHYLSWLLEQLVDARGI